MSEFRSSFDGYLRDICPPRIFRDALERETAFQCWWPIEQQRRHLAGQINAFRQAFSDLTRIT